MLGNFGENAMEAFVEKIVIMMAAYNGVKYIKQQMDSILSQTGDFQILLQVYDDASTDGTQEVLREYEKLYPNVKCIFADKNQGFKNSFWTLLKNAQEADYYAWADQDDIWKEDKLDSAITAIKKMKSDRGVLWCSNYGIINEENVMIGKMCLDKNNFEKPYNKKHFICLTEIPGCMQVFDNKLKYLIDRTAEYALRHEYAHDAWTAVNAVYCGDIILDTNLLTLHRRHATSITNNSRSGLNKYIHMLKLAKRSLCGKQYTNYGLGVYEALKDYVKDRNDMYIAEAFAKYKVSWKAKKILLFDKEIRQRNWFSTALLKLCILISKY